MNPNDKTYNYNLYLSFLKERESIRLKKESGHPFPWTDDPILRDYKFTNVSRKHDAFTIKLGKMANEWLKTQKPEDVIFNILVHRSHSKTDTLERWVWLENSKDAKEKLLKDKERGIISMTGAFLRCKPTEQFTDSWDFYYNNRKKLVKFIQEAKSLKQLNQQIKSWPMLGRFMSWQTLCDLKLFGFIPSKPDDETFVVLGPGARKGIKLMPEHLRNPLALLNAIREDSKELRWMQIEDVEHSLCEYYKYHRAMTGGTMPKQRYMTESRTGNKNVIKRRVEQLQPQESLIESNE